MKKFCIAACLALVFGVYTLVGCTDVMPQESGKDHIPAETETETEGGFQGEKEPQEGADREEKDEVPKEEEPKEDEHKEDEPKEEEPVISPLAVLDTVDVSAAFGRKDAEGWSFALAAEGDLNASYGFRLTSEIEDEEKLNLGCGIGVGLEDLFGIRSNDSNALGFGLYGGGEARLSLNYRGLTENPEPVQKNFDVGFRHDGDLIWYAGEDKNEAQISLSELKEKIEKTAVTETFKRMENAFLIIPEELQKGGSLRLAVEKLIDLGFTAEIDDSDGVAILLRANAGFYTDLLNDMLEQFIPAKWLDYLPRADFGYERTVFDIKLSFDKNGIFREYSMSSDLALTASLEVRKLFFSESTLKASGKFAFTAQDGELTAGEQTGSGKRE